MSKLRRYPTLGRAVFVANVTFQRRPLLVDHIDLLQSAIENTRTRAPFDLVAWVVLPDHFHLLIDPHEASISTLMQRIKLSFATALRHRLKLRSGRVWQNRFWDHIIRDQEDMNRHIDYIHFNSVKHGYATSPFDWPHSSAGEYLERNTYDPDWGTREKIIIQGEFGE